MANRTTLENLQQILSRSIDNKRIFGVSTSLAKGDGSLGFIGSAGNLDQESQFFIASTTKLFTSATAFRLREQARISLDDPISLYVDRAILKGLLVFKGVDYSDRITIRHLLANTSGLPDYFQQKKGNGVSLQDELTSGKDQRWDFEQVITQAKAMKPAFRPGEEGKALYSDTNYQLLGKIIETVTGKPVSVVFDEFIATPLGLKRTYLYTDSNDARPAVMYYKGNPLRIPLAMTSSGADGGVVSTAADLMTFIQAFFNGLLFPIEYFEEMKRWNKIFYPLEYGIGLARFKLPRIFSPFKAMPELIGHSGLSGAFAFYSPEKDLFLAGTVNQITNPDLSFRLMLRLMNSLKEPI